MESPALTVLLLGWDDTPRPAEPAPPAPLSLARALASQATLSVILPHLPTPIQTTPYAHVTGLGDLSLTELETVAGASVNRPAGEWEAPAAPYVGASPDAPKIALPAPATMPEAEAPAAGGLLDRDDFAVETAEPDFAEASDLGQLDGGTAPVEAPSAPTNGHAELEGFSPFILSNDRATLAQALDALRNSPPDAGDLNYRVIQYARFATRLAAAESFGVIYASDWPVWLAALEIRQITGRPLVLHVHSLATDRDTPADRGWGLELERLTLRRADLLLADTDAVAQRLTEEYSALAGRVRVVAPGNEDALLAALRTFDQAA